jgi:hypothetical protein
VVGNVSFTQKLRPMGAPQGSYIWETIVETEEGLATRNLAAVCQVFRTGQGSQDVRQNMMHRRSACSEVGFLHFEQIFAQ